MENEQKEPMTNEEQAAKEQPFSERLNELESRLIDDFRTDLLRRAEETISRQEKQIADLQQNAIALRDEVALKCYVPLIKEVSNYDKAASDAYHAADVFLRVREGMSIISNEDVKS